ncbi:intercellular adhesion molecule 4 [Monodelphis domestica]|uniref:intercellular adhesion molecule 4 n=1 Tax=Monodelphis domestica TaxID=13616 RepID=UPI0004434972|nr:intercellular adhesion molecule 4 [Monodelphis domestica]
MTDPSCWPLTERPSEGQGGAVHGFISVPSERLLSPGLLDMGAPCPLALLILLRVAIGGGQEVHGPFWVRVLPEEVNVPPGSSVWINCSTNCVQPEAWGLTTSLIQGKTETGPSWAAFQVLDVRAWHSAARCFFTCAGQTQEATATIKAYSPPQSVILEQPPPLDVGTEFKFRCHVSFVFPLEKLTLTLKLGARALYSVNLAQSGYLSESANVTWTEKFLPRLQDMGQLLSCHAQLNLNGFLVIRSSKPVRLHFRENLMSIVASWVSLGVLAGFLLLTASAVFLWKPRGHPTGRTPAERV